MKTISIMLELNLQESHIVDILKYYLQALQLHAFLQKDTHFCFAPYNTFEYNKCTCVD